MTTSDFNLAMTAIKYVVVVGILFSHCNGGEEDWAEKPTENSHPCYRSCKEGDIKTCKYTFVIENYYTMSKACYDCPITLEDCYRENCVAMDGIKRKIVVVNRQIPGPKIEVCLGDKIVVDVENKISDETTTIHWHGLHQATTPYMDGVPFITQCPINPKTVFRYTMYANNLGTNFWHSHSGLQRGDGMFGALVVRQPDSDAKNKDLYDQDLSEHIMVINDWANVTGMSMFQRFYQSDGDNKGDRFLINGMGRYYNDTVQLTSTPLAVFTVTQGLRYRFRLINANSHDCPVDIHIDNHTITAIASDGYDFEPRKVDSIVSIAGERWDFVMSADQPVDNYWIRFTGLIACVNNKAHQVAIIHYEGAENVEPKLKVGYNVHAKSELQLNAINVPFDKEETLSVPKLRSVDKNYDPILTTRNPDISIFLPFDFRKVNNTIFHTPPLFGYNQVNSTFQRLTPQLDHVSFKTPSSPLLSQYMDVDPNIYCENQDTSKCITEFCMCTKVINISLHSIVEIILVDEGVPLNANHAFHLHGYGFRVIGMDRLGNSTSLEEVQKLDREGKLERNFEDPPFKDTITVPDGGYTVLRFFANNIGVWVFHCHIEFHNELGMALVFKVGEPSEYPPVPKGFPKCGDFTC